MTSPPDKLFHDKLEHLRKTPPPAAWNRIESGLEKNNPKRTWLMIAAGVTILLAVSITLWNTHGTSEISPVIAIEKTGSSETPNKSETPNHIVANESVVPIEKPSSTNITPPPTVSKSLTLTTPEISQTINVVSNDVIENQPQEKLPVIVSTPEIVSTSVIQEQIDEPNIATPSQSNKLIYTANEVNARFLKKKTTDIALTNEKAPSGIQLIFDFAYDLKNEETVYSDLRGLKNEILSLPSKEKTRTQ